MPKLIFFYITLLFIIGCSSYGPKDTQAPTLVVYSPTNGQIFNSLSNIMVRGVAKDKDDGYYSGINFVELVAYNTISSNSEGVRTIWADKNSNLLEFNWESVVNFLEYGSNEIKVRAFDKSYNESQTIIVKVFVLSN